MNQCVLPANVASIVLCAATEKQGRFGATTGVQVSIGDSTYKAVATDGIKLAIITGPNAGNLRDFGELRIGEPVEQAVLPAEDFASIFGAKPKPILEFDEDELYDDINELRKRLGIKIGSPDIRKAFVALGSTSSILASMNERTKTNQKREVKNVEGRFPDVDAVLPKIKPVASAEIDPAMLIPLLQIAAGLHTDSHRTTLEICEGIEPPLASGKNKKKSPTATLNNYVVLRTENAEGQEFTGVLVQLPKVTQPKEK